MQRVAPKVMQVLLELTRSAGRTLSRDELIDIETFDGVRKIIKNYAAPIRDALDARFCEKVDLKRQDRVLAAARWTNIMLQPPSQALGMLIGTMSQNQALADEFTENFNYPDLQWDRIATPERIQRWINRLSAPAERARATA